MTFNLTSSIVQPAFGIFSDRRGASWLLPAGVMVAGLGFAMVGLSPNYLVLLLAVLISGLGVASYHPEGFKTARFFTGSRQATGMSVFLVGGSLGWAVGPLLMIGAQKWLGLPGTALFAIPGLVTGAILLASLPWLSAPQREQKENEKDPRNVAPKPLGKRWVPLTLLILGLATRSWVQTGMLTFIPFYFVDVLRGSPLIAGKLLTLFALAATVGALAGSAVADRIGHKPFLICSSIPLAPLLWLFLQSQGLAIFVVIAIVGAVLVSSHSVTVVMAQRILPDRLGMASGLTAGFAIGAGGIGAAILGAVADSWGVLRVLQIIACLPALTVLFAILLPYPRERDFTSR
jgi:FSR family fosmidomycin resistance protein-like MFS transporter